MDENELSQKMANLLLEFSSDPRNYVDPLLHMFAQIEKKLYWEQESTPPPSHFVEFITLLDILESGIDEWFKEGNWHFDDLKFTAQGGPRLRKVNYDQDLINQIVPLWLQRKMLDGYSRNHNDTNNE